jgi:hypothetical protein
MFRSKSLQMHRTLMCVKARFRSCRACRYLAKCIQLWGDRSNLGYNGKRKKVTLSLGGWIDRHFLDLGTSWSSLVSFTSRPLYPWEEAPGTPWIGGWVGPTAGLNDVEKRKFLTLSGLQLRTLGRPFRSQSLYRLRYPGSWGYKNIGKLVSVLSIY